MLLFLYVLTFVSYVVSTPTIQSIETRIAGGHDIDITEAPYQVSYELGVNTRQYCGGVIVAKDIVLTAAHCVNGDIDGDPKKYQVRAGSSFTQKGGQLYPVGDLLWHPDYDLLTLHCDIAIFWLSKPLIFSDSVAPIQMMSVNEEVPDGKQTVVTGWGSLYEVFTVPTLLQSVTVPKMTDKLCSDAYQPRFQLTRTMFCAGFMEGGKDACPGDSGGPLVYNSKLAGLVSWGVGCARQDNPGVYTKISALRPWIDKNIAQLRLKNSS